MTERKFVPLINGASKNTEPKETPVSEKDRIELAALQAQADIERSKADAIIAENNLKLKLAEANIGSLEDFIKLRGEYNQCHLELERELAEISGKRAILDDLLEKTDDLFALLQETIKHQEALTKDANDKLSLASSKMDNYTALQEKKCAECLRRDKSKCDKCNYKKFCENIKRNDYHKWLEKLGE